MLVQHAANDIVVELNAEGISNLLGNAHAAELGIAGLQRNDRAINSGDAPLDRACVGGLQTKTADDTCDRPRPCGI